jgi:single-strand DNA-binding protein
MPSINKVTLLGHLGAEPVLKYTPSGQAVCELSLATTEKWNDKFTNDKKEKTTWHRIKIWGKQAESCAQYLYKGALVHVEGGINNFKYEKDGQERWGTEINGRSVIFLSYKQDKNATGGQGTTNAQQELPEHEPSAQVPDDDDIPF